MLLAFKRRFEPMITDGSKTHTIRAKRKRRPRVGETCHCYVDPRQKTMRLLGRWKCVKVEDITFICPPIEIGFGAYQVRVLIGDVELSSDEKDALAWRDGFRQADCPDRRRDCFLAMVTFWLDANGLGDSSSWTGDLIHWDFARGPEAKR